MDIIGKELKLSTDGFSDIKNITGEVDRYVSESGVTEGLINIHIIGSTASVTTIEFEPALVKDMQEKLEEFASKDVQTRHGKTWGDDNGFSHLRASFMGPGISVPIHHGEPVLGTWQQIVVVDHDNRSRQRRVFLQIMGNK